MPPHSNTLPAQRSDRLLPAALLAVTILCAALPVAATGLLVEDVPAASDAALLTGDVLVGWQGVYLADQQRADGTFLTPFDWYGLRDERPAFQTLTLYIERAGERRQLPISDEAAAVQVTPRWTPQQATRYRHGGEEVGTHLSWEHLADELARDGRPVDAAWLAGERAAALSRDDPQIAQPAWETALQLAAESGDRAALATLWHQRGNSWDEHDLYAAAASCYQQAIAIRRDSAAQSLGLGESLHARGRALFFLGDVTAAEALWREAAALRRQRTPGTALLASSLNNLGVALQDLADYRGAEQMLGEALAIKQAIDPDSLDVAKTLNNLGNLAYERGDLATTERHYRASRTLRERHAPGSLDVATILNNLGGVVEERGDFVQAENWYRQALAIRQRLAPQSLIVATTLSNLGTHFVRRGEPSKATPLLEQALAIAERMAPESLEAAWHLTTLGNLRLEENDLEAADALHRRALAIHERRAGQSLYVAEILLALGRTARQRGDFGAAEREIRRALALCQRIAPGTHREGDAWHELARLHHRAGALDAALTAYEHAIATLEAQRGRLGESQQRGSQFTARYLDWYRETAALLVALARPAEAFAVLERSRARGMLALLAERDLVFNRDLPAEIEAERRHLAADYERSQLALETVDPADPSRADQLIAHLDTLRDQRLQMEARIRQLSPRLAHLAYPQPLDLAAAHHALDADTVMLVYSVGVTETLLFVVPGGGDIPALTVRTLPIGRQALDQEIDAFRLLLQTPKSALHALAARGRSLHNHLLRPVADSLAAGQRLLVVPDGPLHRLPFAALVTTGGDDARTPPVYLIEHHALHVAVSATVYAELQGRQPAMRRGTRLAAFGDPTLPHPVGGATGRRGAPGREQPRLPASRDEARAIFSLFPVDAALWLGDKATETRAKHLDAGFDLIHFATHAAVDDRVPLDSYLALGTGPASGGGVENGRLQAWEVLEQVRLEAELVTLSGCETGLGRELDGEGIVGLVRAFQFAGARAVLASLWRVSDRATAELMVRFYTHLGTGRAKADALADAQRTLLREPITAAAPAARHNFRDRLAAWLGSTPPIDLTHPYYWSAFQLFGASTSVSPSLSHGTVR